MRTLLVVVLLALASCSRIASPGIQVDAKLKPYILPNSKFLAGIDLDKIRQTEFFRRHQSQLDIPQLNQLPQEIGMDPRRDLSSFLMSWNGADSLFLTRGTYSSDTLEKRLNNVAKTENYGKFKFYGDGKRDVVFLPKGIALIGAVPLLKSAVKENGSAISEDLQMQLARIGKDSQIWEASSGIIAPEQLAVRSDTASLLSNISRYINGTSLGVTLGSGVALDAHISCISEEGSTRVHDALRGIIGLARLSTKDNELDQLKIWDSIKVDKQAKEVHITADLPPAVADKAIDILKGSTYRLR